MRRPSTPCILSPHLERSIDANTTLFNLPDAAPSSMCLLIVWESKLVCVWGYHPETSNNIGKRKASPLAVAWLVCAINHTNPGVTDIAPKYGL